MYHAHTEYAMRINGDSYENIFFVAKIFAKKKTVLLSL